MRSIIREHEFEEQLDALICNAEEADDFVMAAERVLSQDSDIGKLLDPKERIYSLPMAPVRGRAVALFYTFNESVVTFIYIVAYD